MSDAMKGDKSAAIAPIAPRRRHAGGRPRGQEPGSTMTIWLPASDHDRLIQAANAHHLTVSSLVRLLLQMDLGLKP